MTSTPAIDSRRQIPIRSNASEPFLHSDYFWTTAWVDASIIAIMAIVIRAVIFCTVLATSKTSLSKYADLFDGRSYLITARAMDGDWTHFDEYQGRVFPGFPAALALLHRLGIPIPIAGVSSNWIGAALAAGAVVLLFRDVRIGCATAVLMPHYLMNSSLSLSEAPMLGLSCAALALIWQKDDQPLPLWQVGLGGILLGAAGVVRPMACFAALAFTVVAINQRRWTDLLTVVVTSTAVVFVTLWRVQQWRGDSLASVRYYANSHLTYGGQLFTYPFHSLLSVSFSGSIPVGRLVYIWVHVAILLLACAMVISRALLRRSIDLLSATWLISNTLFILCIGSVWGFQCFHRFAVPALPAAYWNLSRYLPRHWMWWVGISLFSAVVAVLIISGELGIG